MTIFLYRWKVKSGKEIQFEESWSIVTKAMREQCGSYGSRLHVAMNGDYISYAQWPDARTREKCELAPVLLSARASMQEAIEFAYPSDCLVVKEDLIFYW